MADRDRENQGGAVRPSRIAWFSIFACGLVVGLVIGLGLSPHGPESSPPAPVSAQEQPAQADPPKYPPTKAPAALLAGAPAPSATARPEPQPAPPPASSAAPASSPISLVSIAQAAVSKDESAPAASTDRPLTIGVFGDSLADGLWAGLYRQMHSRQGVQVVKFSQPATGLSRYDYVNVQQKTEAQLAQRHVDVAVVLFGTNDQQGIVEGGHVNAFGSPGWRQAYARRVDALVATLRRQGARVYWVGLPRMRSETFDRRAQAINGLYGERMTALGARFVPTVGATSDPAGAYAPYLPTGAAGRPTLMRANDGIHMTMSGYLRIAEPVSAAVRADLQPPAASRRSLNP